MIHWFGTKVGKTVLVLALIVALILRARIDVIHTADLNIAPDAVEYSVLAQRLVTTGRLDLPMNEMSVPPRYLPWFSILAVAPFHLLNPSNPGVLMLLLVLICAVCVLAVFRLGERIQPDGGGLTAMMVTMLFTPVPYWCQFVMTDVPTMVLGLIAVWLFLDFVPSTPPKRWLLAGSVCALAFSFRQIAIFYAVPFLLMAWREKEGRVARLVALLSPLVVVGIAGLLYNHAIFGEWGRNGYQYWVPAIYDVPGRVFSVHALKANLIAVFKPPILPLYGLGFFGWRASRNRPESDPSKRIMRFVLWAALPITVIHLFYFFIDLRFHLLFLTLLAVFGSAEILKSFPENIRRGVFVLNLILLLFTPPIAAWMAARRPPPSPPWWSGATQIRQATPPDAVIISGIDPVYLTAYANSGTRETKRFFLPIDRKVEYASKIVAPHHLNVPPPVERLPLYPALKVWAKGSGATSLVPFTASEAPDKVERWLRAGKPVYLETSSLKESAETLQFLQKAFVLNPVPNAPLLMKLELRR